MPSAPTPPHRLPAASVPLAGACAVALASLGLALGGCGSSNSGATNADPASAVPAATAVYVGATVRPSGSEKTAAADAGQALTHQRDPYLRLLGALQTPGSPQLSFSRDVAPWLGEHAGVFVSSLSSSGSLLGSLAQGVVRGSAPGSYPFSAAGTQGALVMDTSDASKARSFLDAQAAHAGAHAASYRGVSFQVTAAGLAFGLVEHFAVIGSESGLHGVVDTTLGASSLSHQDGYSKLLAAAPTGAIAHVYLNPSSASASQPAPSKAAATQGGLGDPLSLLIGTREANISLVPSATSVAVDADTLATGAPEAAHAEGGTATSAATEGLLAPDGEGARALSELPGESWLAVGLGHLATSLARDARALQSVTSLGGVLGGAAGAGAGATSGTFGVKGLLEALTAPLGVLGADTAQARRDFASWMGSAGIFATGASLLELKAAVTIESHDPAMSKAAVNELGAELHRKGWSVAPVSIPGTDAAVGARVSGLPVVLDIANGTDSSGHTRFVLGLGEASVQAALNPPNTMSSSTTTQAAAAALGEGISPSLIVDFPTLLSLFEGIGLTEAPEIAPLVPYLHAATTLVGGGHALGGNVERFRLVLGLQPTTG